MPKLKNQNETFRVIFKQCVKIFESKCFTDWGQEGIYQQLLGYYLTFILNQSVSVKARKEGNRGEKGKCAKKTTTKEEEKIVFFGDFQSVFPMDAFAFLLGKINLQHFLN